jgi:hypothetical protein
LLFFTHYHLFFKTYFPTIHLPFLLYTTINHYFFFFFFFFNFYLFFYLSLGFFFFNFFCINFFFAFFFFVENKNLAFVSPPLHTNQVKIDLSFIVKSLRCIMIIHKERRRSKHQTKLILRVNCFIFCQCSVSW